MKIISWNTQWFKGLDGVVDISWVVAQAREMADFDALCLQEVAVNYGELSGGAQADQPAVLATLLPGFQVFFSPAIDELSADGTCRQRFGNLIATRLPVRMVQHVPLPYPSFPSDEPVLSMQRICAICTVQAEWGPVRLMTSHLEYYSQAIRLAQAEALRDLHVQATALAGHPPRELAGTPYQTKPHTVDAILCGDFNFAHDSVEHAAVVATGSGNDWRNAWDHLHPGQRPPATFRLFDRTYGPEPVGCDFFFVSESVIHRVRNLVVDQQTRASDHQPVLLEIG